MNLNLNRPLCFFDLETTGIDIANDRIVEIAILKLMPDGEKREKVWLVNPGCPIPQAASDVHGITDDKVASAPSFKQIAADVNSFIDNSDLAGYNSDRFDIPLLAEEMLRAEFDFDLSTRKTVDVQTIFHKMEKRTLTAALKFYCDQTLENAHSALADTQATHDVLQAQIERYDDLQNDISFLSEFSSHRKTADLAGFIVFNSKEQECFGFGKHKGKTVEQVLEQEPGYFGWLLNADFPRYTKKILTQIRLRKLNSNS